MEAINRNSNEPTIELTEKQRRFCEEYKHRICATTALIASELKSAESRRRFYVYFLINSISGHIFYVGKGKGKRSKSHIANFKNQKEQNPAKELAMRETIENGGNVCDFVFADNLTEAAAFILERRLIRTFPSLTNIANGKISADELYYLRAKAGLAKMITEEEMLSRPPDPRFVGTEIDPVDLYYRIKAEYQKMIDKWQHMQAINML